MRNDQSMIKKMTCIIIFVTLCLHGLFAQGDEKKVRKIIQSVSETYAHSFLHFDVAYYYADEMNPGQNLDSLKGQFKFYKNKFWYRLDNTEAMSDSSNFVTLFGEDQLMYLSKLPKNNLSTNPLGQLDSVLTYLENQHIHFSLKEGRSENILTFEFDSVTTYKRVVYVIDAKTNFIKRIDNTVNASELYDPSARPLLEKTEKYVIVKAVMNNYGLEKIDPSSFFNTEKYYRKESGKYIAVAPFENYRIFLATPNL
jgi:hypothetical protein